MRKRKAAADVFMQQNIQQVEGEETLYDMDEFEMSSGAKMDQEQRKSKPATPPPMFKTSEELQLEKEPIQVRETGFWLWKQVIVPPNAYVVHTRLGKKDPITIGLGVSFRYNSFSDAYLVVPAAMQTIGVIANCISKEKQGINVLAYVQWQIDDFAVAYRKLDFSDLIDPLGIVNAQLREQAEAAIKDKIATMSVEEVLTDKEPVIEELTSRLKTVAEGRSQDSTETDAGLGIKIVTVQIKEALVSSQRLWENLQAPFRHEKDRIARISRLESEDQVRKSELETHQQAETREAETRVNIERIKQSKETEATEIRLNEESTRFTREQETERTNITLQEQTTLTRRESEQRLALQAAQAEQAEHLAELQRSQQAQIEQARLESEAQVKEKELYVEQALQELNEEQRLAQAQFEAEQQQLTRNLTLKSQEAEFELTVQGQKEQLVVLIQQAELARKQYQTEIELELEAARNNVHMALEEKKVEIERLQQEVRNLINQGDLSSRLVEALPDLAAQMPEIQELKVLQTGTDGAFDSLSAFLAQMLAVADSLGIPLQKKDE